MSRSRRRWVQCKVCHIRVQAVSRVIAYQIENATPGECFEWHGAIPVCRDAAFQAMGIAAPN